MPRSCVIVAKTNAKFDEVVEVIKKIEEASSIHTEYFERAVVFIGEKYFFRSNSWASAITIVKDLGKEVIIRIITTGSGRGLLNIDYGANKSYARDIIDQIKRKLAVEIIKEIDNYNISMLQSAFLPEE
ncbi:DUF6054 family protein [Pyrococcus sp. ST04]|uniref:DUF6054 family protein n=1 Tax=Pyrococcus sp. ST04 TaxID=1183377 RepID=UPI0002605C90|nr:DUF6054 family protein [Pyrococcus sp. ST04]AFK22392.1 hypothetical protein Py04_0794 [Pyrococcus sp. ST04]